MEQILKEFSGKVLSLPALPASFIKVDFVDDFEDGFVSLLEIF
jgi:hypothetical protein